MRRISIVLIALSVGGTLAYAAGREMSGNVHRVVLSSLAGERTAAARYEAYAAKATEDGYPGAATLFKAAAMAEKTHASRFAAVLKDCGKEVPEPELGKYSIGSTSDNLSAAAAAEQSERDGTYKQAWQTCRSANDEVVAKLFDQTRDVEVEHANLFGAAARQLQQLKEPKAYYVCRVCGYTSDLHLPLCPLCRDTHALREVD